MSCGPPRCTSPLTAGGVGAGSFFALPDAGCQHVAPTHVELRSILAGQHLTVCGGSNAAIQFFTYANSYVPGVLDFAYRPPPLGIKPSAQVWSEIACTPPPRPPAQS